LRLQRRPQVPISCLPRKKTVTRTIYDDKWLPKVSSQRWMAANVQPAKLSNRAAER